MSVSARIPRERFSNDGAHISYKEPLTAPDEYSTSYKGFYSHFFVSHYN